MVLHGLEFYKFRCEFYTKCGKVYRDICIFFLQFYDNCHNLLLTGEINVAIYKYDAMINYDNVGVSKNIF
jgi:hypothetical protein